MANGYQSTALWDHPNFKGLFGGNSVKFTPATSLVNELNNTYQEYIVDPISRPIVTGTAKAFRDSYNNNPSNMTQQQRSAYMNGLVTKGKGAAVNTPPAANLTGKAPLVQPAAKTDPVVIPKTTPATDPTVRAQKIASGGKVTSNPNKVVAANGLAAGGGAVDTDARGAYMDGLSNVNPDLVKQPAIPTPIQQVPQFSASKVDQGFFGNMINPTQYQTNTGNTYTGIGDGLYQGGSTGNTVLTGDALNNNVQWNEANQSFDLINPSMNVGGGGLSLGGVWDGIGGAKGFSDVMGGLGAGMSMYSQYKQNKLAEDAHNARMGEYNRQVRRDQDFAKGIAKSGLGTYSAGV